MPAEQSTNWGREGYGEMAQLGDVVDLRELLRIRSEIAVVLQEIDDVIERWSMLVEQPL